MSASPTNADLASWGEPPASSAENVLANFLDKALEMVACGAPVQTEQLLAASPELRQRGEHLFKDLKTLCRAASSIWEHSGLLNSTRRENAAESWAEATLPDPFPGEFQVRRLLGSGSFGEVWLAEDLNLRRPVALKTLRLADVDQCGLLETLRNEARLLAALRHPNIVQVHAWRQRGEENYLVLQYVSGGSLADRVRKEGPLPWEQAARYVADVAEGLLQVHACGIIHRDVKPADVLWDPETDEALLTDFGVSARLAAVPVGQDSVAGTPLFMAPEAFQGHSTPAQDVYALAATLFWLITAEVPFPCKSLHDLLGQIDQGLANPDPRCASLPLALETVIRNGLAANPDHRPTLHAFASALRGSLNQLLSDHMACDGRVAERSSSAATPVDLRLIVSRQDLSASSLGARFVPVLATHARPEQLLRDLKRVPATPGQIDLRTGDRVRIEVAASRVGFLTVFNVGPTGNVNLLYPGGGVSTQPLPAGQVLHIVDVELTPPSGTERLFALWSRTPLPLRRDELFSLAEGGQLPVSGPYRATRDMVRMQESLRQLAPENWHAVVLELNHSA